MRQKQLIYLLTSMFSFDIARTAMKQKLVGEGRRVKTEQHLQPACDAWPAEGRQTDKTRSNANTKRVSGVSLIITRHVTLRCKHSLKHSNCEPAKVLTENSHAAYAEQDMLACLRWSEGKEKT